MSRSWRAAPDAPLIRKPQYEPTVEEEMASMDRLEREAIDAITEPYEAAERSEDLNPEEIFIVVNEWPASEDVYLTEDIAIKRTHASAWLVLQGLAEGQGIDLPHNDTSFTNESDETWYITTGVLED